MQNASGQVLTTQCFEPTEKEDDPAGATAFTLRFSFTDANGDASNWHLTAERADGTLFDMDQGAISPPSGSGTITRISSGFSCPSGNCPNSQWQIHVVITDTTGLQSQPATVGVFVFGAIP